MNRLLTDQDYRQEIVRGLRRILHELDVVTRHVAGLSRAEDEDVLRFAASEDRKVLTHDAKTMPRALQQLIAHRETVPRVLLVPQKMATGTAIEQVAIVLVAGTDADWQAGYIRLPL